MKPLIVIPARGGSKRLPNKNIKPLNGKPLIHYTIEVAREMFDDSIICVSTDDENIITVVEETGLKVPFIRPKDLSTDTADSRSVLLHAHKFYSEKKNYNANVIILLQVTSPIRNAKHVKEAIEMYSETLDMVVSVKETDSNPYFVLFEENKLGYLEKSKSGDFTRSQDCPKVWEVNGAIYVINADSLLKKPINDFKMIKKYRMDSLESVDIDNLIDFKFVSLLLNNES